MHKSSISARQWALGVLIGCALGKSIARADSAATQPSPDELRPIVHLLDDPDVAVRDGAQVALTSQLLAVPAYEKALADEDLGPEGKARLQHCINLLKPGYPARVRKWQLRNVRMQWNAENGVEAYKAIGHRSPKWDDAAIAALETGEDALSREQVLNRDVRTHLGELCDQAIAAGCDDPRILYARAIAVETLGKADATQAIAAMRLAAHALAGSKYSPFLRADAAARAVNIKRTRVSEQSLRDSAEDRELCDSALALLPEIAKEKHMIGPAIGSLAMTLQNDYKAIIGDDQEAFNLVYPVLLNSMPHDPTPHVFKGTFYTNYAWIGRDIGRTDFVSDEGWKAYAQRLSTARSALEKAYALAPTDSRAPVQMLTVELAQGRGRYELELWFNRAVAADPDNTLAYWGKLYYLEPRWHGTKEELLEFGRECLKTENWFSEVPLLVVEAHLTVSKQQPNPDDYFKDPKVWQDIDQAYRSFLIARPTYDWARSKYALMACRCGQFVVADQQFKILGDRVVVAAFGDKAKLDEWRQKAAQATAEPVTGSP